MNSDVITPSVEQITNTENENFNEQDYTETNDEKKYWSKILNYNLSKIKRSENSTHVTGKNSCIETDFKREMKRYYVGLKQSLDKIDRYQEEVAIKMNRLYKESRELARRSRNEKKQSLKLRRRISSQYKGIDLPLDTVEEGKGENETEKELNNHPNEISADNVETVKELIPSPWLPVINPTKFVSLTSNLNKSSNTKIETNDNVKPDLDKPDIPTWLENVKEEIKNSEEQVPITTLKIDTSTSESKKRYNNYIRTSRDIRRSVNYLIIMHRESRLSHLKAALSETPIAYLWKGNSATSISCLRKAKLISSKYRDFDLQAKRCIPGYVGGISSDFLEAVALPKPALIRFPPPTSMHNYRRKKRLVVERQQMQQSLGKMNAVIEDIKKVLESQKLLAALEFLLAPITQNKDENGTTKAQ
uniref:Uncharacterized protein n=1 Tax=Trichobilharzia regenti TaxID=157069 RepID=A0AA85KN07_TRIRE|nr:unnamed protein product [Trichobilharzia regenti]